MMGRPKYPVTLCLLIQPHFNPGDKPPENAGYLEWHEWADVQHKAGIRQSRCPCGKLITPQEHEDHIDCAGK